MTMVHATNVTKLRAALRVIQEYTAKVKPDTLEKALAGYDLINMVAADAINESDSAYAEEASRILDNVEARLPALEERVGKLAERYDLSAAAAKASDDTP